MCNKCDNDKNDRCRIAVTVEDDLAPCRFPKNLFDIEIRSDGKTAAEGKVKGGDSEVFELPCGKTYSVTVTGNRNSSPRAQTRRVRCECGETSGVTFIFTTFGSECEKRPKPPEPPCREHPKPPCKKRCAEEEAE